MLQRQHFSNQREKESRPLRIRGGGRQHIDNRRQTFVPRCVAYRKTWRRCEKGRDEKRQLTSRLILLYLFSVLLKAGKCINAASHNTDYTRVEGIKREILLEQVTSEPYPVCSVARRGLWAYGHFEGDLFPL